MRMNITFSYDENDNISIIKSDSVKAQNTKPKREHKGKSKLEFVDDYIVLDLETTGLDSGFDNIIEIGALKVCNGLIIDKYTSLVNPLFEVDEFITELTGITNEMLAPAPVIGDVLPNLLSFIGDSVIIAHNANFDINFLYDNCLSENHTPFTNNFIDTMRISRRLFKDFKSHRLSFLMDALKLDGCVDHRALADCICAYNLYEYMKKYASSNNIDISISSNKKKSNALKATNITSTKEDFDENHSLFGKVCVFTGSLENLTRKEAMQIVADLGGINGDNVTKKTNFLILGNNDYCTKIKDGKSNKQKKAEELILKGQDLEVISENSFFDMI